MDGGGVRVEERVSKRLAELIETGQRVLETRRSLGPSVMGDDRVDSQLALQWSTSTQSLLASVFGADSEHYKAFVRHGPLAQLGERRPCTAVARVRIPQALPPSLQACCNHAARHVAMHGGTPSMVRVWCSRGEKMAGEEGLEPSIP